MKLVKAISRTGVVHQRVGEQFRVLSAAPAAKSLKSLQRATKSYGAYDAALVNRLTDDWPIQILSADAATRWSLRQLRARSRHLERNGGIHEAYLNSTEANVIGARGIQVQMKILNPVDRPIVDPREQFFLKALQADATQFLTHPRALSRVALGQWHSPLYRAHVVHAARALKSAPLFSQQGGDMVAPGGDFDRYACFTVEQWWRSLARRGAFDVTGKHSAKDFCRLALRTSVRDGDALILVYGNYPNEFKVSFQLIEGDYLDDYYNDQRLPNGNTVRMGVELDPFRKKVAYWLFANHPGDYGVEGMYQYDGRRVRIPALGCEPEKPVHVIHVSRSKRAEETRAVPWITPAMNLVNQLEGYKDAEIVAARCEAAKHIFYERDLFAPDGSPLEWPEDMSKGELIDDVEPGGSTELPLGYRANVYDPKHPNEKMPDFLKAMKREVAMAVNRCYNTLFGDLEAVNYSSIRSGTLNEREAYMMEQSWFGDDVFEPMFETALQWALIGGALPFPLSDFDRLNNKIIKFRRWPWVDPKNDAETAVLQLTNKLRTRSQIISDMSSDDFEETIDELDYEEGYIASKANLQPAPEAASPTTEAETLPAEPGKKPAPSTKSAFLGDVAISSLPEDSRRVIDDFFPNVPAAASVVRYQMTVPELLQKADQQNLQSARHRIRNMTNAGAGDEVREAGDKQILLLNDRIIDGHHHLAKAEKGNITNSLPVLDLTPLRFHPTKSLHPTESLAPELLAAAQAMFAAGLKGWVTINGAHVFIDDAGKFQGGKLRFGSHLADQAAHAAHDASHAAYRVPSRESHRKAARAHVAAARASEKAAALEGLRATEHASTAAAHREKAARHSFIAQQTPPSKVGKTPVHRVADFVPLDPSASALAPASAHAFAQVDKIHGGFDKSRIATAPDFALRDHPLDASNIGEYTYAGNVTHELRVASAGPYPEFTTTHELGHLVDHQVLGNGHTFASDDDTSPLMTAIHSGQGPEDLAIMHQGAVQTGDPAGKHLEYLASPKERFARAYSHYVAVKSQDSKLLAALAEERASTYGRQMYHSDAEFPRVAEEFDQAFAAKGLRP